MEEMNTNNYSFTKTKNITNLDLYFLRWSEIITPYPKIHTKEHCESLISSFLARCVGSKAMIIIHSCSDIIKSLQSLPEHLKLKKKQVKTKKKADRK